MPIPTSTSPARWTISTWPRKHGGRLADAFAGAESAVLPGQLRYRLALSHRESRLIAHALNAAGAPVSFVELSAPFGHDSFLLDVPALDRVIAPTSGPDWLLEQLLRIGRTAFVSFPNFAYWRMRVSLLVNGRMPVTRHLPVSWYATDNIHHLTVADFRDLLTERGVKVEGSWFFAGGREISGGNANWRAEHAVFRLSR
jgi:hypothetical protein